MSTASTTARRWAASGGSRRSCSRPRRCGWLYSGSRFLTLSHAEAEKIAEHGIPLERIDVNYIGVEQEAFEPGERAPEPTLLYLGRLKRYKRIELLLDALEAVPEAVLEIAGEGDHRDELGRRDRAARAVGPRPPARVRRRGDEAAADAAGVGEPHRVVGRGLVPERDRVRGVRRRPPPRWPSAGCRNRSSTGAPGCWRTTSTSSPLTRRRLVDDGELRESLGRAALARSREFTWDRTAERTLDLLNEVREPAAEVPAMRERLATSDTGRAAGLAAAVIAGNVIALVFTIVFARLLGASGYGTLGALISTFIILQVPGSALQISVAREVSRGIAAGDPNPGAGVVRALRQLLAFAVAVTAIGFLARDWIAAAIGVDAEWAAAAALPTGCLWLLLSVERGALQGFQRYRVVGFSLIGEGAARLVFGLLLYAIGAGVTGAFLGTAASVAAVSLALIFPLRR